MRMDKPVKVWDIRAKGVMHEGTELESGHFFSKRWYGQDAGQVAIAFIESYPPEMRFVEIRVKEAKRYEEQEERPGAAVPGAD